ncbi:sec14 cytosolic factor-like isoform X2 [Diospyros lotus]|uniref:sec14 cytosolic factor-like isoform X2 n=1 Tax=Diospyros lotus TaxID=55363 RepID=UPI002259EC23|nr:sec14 cytosolic factor-like isoform X2 [Diospyros lotus]
MERREIEREVSVNKTEAEERKEKEEEEEEEEEAAARKSSTAVCRINGINEEEKNKILHMRAFVERQDPSSKDVDDFTMRRFLRARDLDIEKASAMFLEYLKWRRTFVPKGFISVSEIQNDLAQNKMFMQGTDRKGRPITVAFGGRHFHNKGGLEDFKRFVVFAIDKLCSRMQGGQEKFAVIGDLEGWGYSNSDIRAYLAALSILQVHTINYIHSAQVKNSINCSSAITLQNYYPERLGKLFLVHVPYIFMAAWKIVYPFIDNNIKKTIRFVENKKLKSTLMEEIDEDQLPEIYGGKLPLIPIQDG